MIYNIKIIDIKNKIATNWWATPNHTRLLRCGEVIKVIIPSNTCAIIKTNGITLDLLNNKVPLIFIALKNHISTLIKIIYAIPL
jgi:hypothetical protein